MSRSFVWFRCRLLIQLALMAFVAWKRVFLIRRHMVFVTAISVAELVAMVCPLSSTRASTEYL